MRVVCEVPGVIYFPMRASECVAAASQKKAKLYASEPPPLKEMDALVSRRKEKHISGITKLILTLLTNCWIIIQHAHHTGKCVLWMCIGEREMRDVGVSSRHHHGARRPGSTELLPILIRVSAAPAVHSGVVLTFYICLCNFHRAPGHADALSAISISWDAERRTKQPEIPHYYKF